MSTPKNETHVHILVKVLPRSSRDQVIVEDGRYRVKLTAPAFPLAAFGEFTYGVIFTSEQLTQKTFAAGLMLKF